MGHDPVCKEGQDVEKLLSITLQNREVWDHTLQFRSYSLVDEAPSEDYLEIRTSDTNISEKRMDGELSPCKREGKQVWFFPLRRIYYRITIKLLFPSVHVYFLCTYRSQKL